jgi:hypothetical protein
MRRPYLSYLVAAMWANTLDEAICQKPASLQAFRLSCKRRKEMVIALWAAFAVCLLLVLLVE